MAAIPHSEDVDNRAFQDPVEFAKLLQSAREGSLAAQGRLLEAFRRDLFALADARLDSGLRPKGGASDLVQESLLEAHRSFGEFRGTCRQEMRAWLKRILLNNLVNHFRRWKALRRAAGREFSVEEIGECTPQSFIDPGNSPCELATVREQQARLEQALTNLSEDHRLVLELRHREGLTFEDIGARMNRHPDAARMLWYRAFDSLSRRLDAPRTVAQPESR